MREEVHAEAAKHEKKVQEEWRQERKIKCLIWDLDNTLWHGTLLESERVSLRKEAVDLIHALDERGILQSIASRNDHTQAMTKLEQFQLQEYFLYPQINWGTKSTSVGAIAKNINIGMESVAFIDDQRFERDEVAHVHPDVLVIDASKLNNIKDMPEFLPRFLTDDSKRRRHMYMADIVRKQVEERFDGPQDQFLRSLGMHLTIAPAKESDLKRAEELTIRTNQLNTTGRTYSYTELDAYRKSERHHLWVAQLTDKYGDYGKIGLVLIEIKEDEWWIRLLLMSCRVMNRGVGAVLINHIRNRAREAGVRLFAEMVPNDRNRMMYMTYKFNHFKESQKQNGLTIFENNLSEEQEFPNYLRLTLI